MNEKRIFFIAGIVSVLYSLVVFVVYYANGYFIRGAIYADAIISYCEIISMVLTPMWSMVAIWIYYQALREQRKQIRQMQTSQFDSLFFELLKQQWEIRSKIKLSLPTISFPSSNTYEKDLVEYQGQKALVELWYRIESLSCGINSNLFECNLEQHEINFWEEDLINQEEYIVNPLETEQKEKYKKNSFYDLSITKYYIPGVYNKNENSPTEQAFALIYSKYYATIHNYFMHIAFVLSCLNKEIEDRKEWCEDNKFDDRNYWLAIIANLSIEEIKLIDCYKKRCRPDNLFTTLLKKAEKLGISISD